MERPPLFSAICGPTPISASHGEFCNNMFEAVEVICYNFINYLFYSADGILPRKNLCSGVVKMKIGIIDADLIGRQKHRFPNLVCEKLSGYWKEQGAEVTLLLDYNWTDDYDHIYISKVFTDTPVPEWLRETPKVHLGGTGFFFDQAPDLPPEIEHHMPDYRLYDAWIEGEVNRASAEYKKQGRKFVKSRFMVQFKEYTDYCIGFVTRGCFRKCPFCVNQKFDRVVPHSPLDEFYYEGCKKICLLDDNFLGCPNWREILAEIQAKKKPFKFKQGLDERLLTDEKCEILFSAKYDGDFTFAFDNIADYDLIHEKLAVIRRHTTSKAVKFYILVGFESTDETDIENAFRRIHLLMQYQCLPYIMRYQDRNYSPWKVSPYKGLYVALARWSNQPSIFKKMSFRQFCEANQALRKDKDTFCSSMAAMRDFEQKFPDIAKKYFDLRYDDYSA